MNIVSKKLYRFILILIYLLPALVFSQTEVKAIIIDSTTKKPLEFCNISSGSKGTITNADGYFSIQVENDTSVLSFSYIGYELLSATAKDIIKTGKVKLNKKAINLEEVVISDNDDYLYEVVFKCRQALLKNRITKKSKVYLGLETNATITDIKYPGQNLKSKDAFKQKQVTEPVELLECFYNADISGQKLNELWYKNGRTALCSHSNYFITHNSSKLFSKIILTKSQPFFPNNPLQFRKLDIKKKFVIVMEYISEDYFKILFTPRSDTLSYFSGELWINKSNFNLIKISLNINNTNKHPFLPRVKTDSVYNIDINLNYTYITVKENIVPGNMVIDYSFTYLSRRDSLSPIKKELQKITTRKICSKAILYFYDYDDPFILPYFDYDNSFGDYQKMSFIPFNYEFWNNSTTIQLTKDQKNNFGLLSNSGNLINFDNNNYGNDFLTDITDNSKTRIYEFFYPFWSYKKRLLPIPNQENYKTYSTRIINNSIPSDLYYLKAQILLDINKYDSTISCKSYSVFDNSKSYFHLPIDSITYAFFNIYFDLIEIERQKMQKKLNTSNFNLQQIDSVYQSTLSNIDDISKQYFKEVNIGYDPIAISKWNNIVKSKLNIDNLKLIN